MYQIVISNFFFFLDLTEVLNCSGTIMKCRIESQKKIKSIKNDLMLQ